MGFAAAEGTVKGRFRLLATVLSTLSLALAFVTGAGAQTQSGRISGSITDPSGAVIPGAIVKATDLGTARDYTAVTDSHGEFVINNVPFGFFKVTVGAKGFATGIVPRVQVAMTQESHITLKLNVAATGTEVVVTGEQAVVQTETAEISNTIDRKQILELPLPTRNPLDLINTMAGMAKLSNGSTNDTFVHGLRGNSTNITQDGINVADNFVKTSSFFAISAPSVDTVGEFNVSVAGSGSNTGFGAAQVTMATQRGSNTLHGSVFWFQRTSFLNANTYFNSAQGLPTPFQLQNRIGANVGGPVFAPKLYNGKNKTWFFLAFEGFREPFARSRNRLVLSDAARTGQFTYTGATDGLSHTVNLLPLGTLGNTGAAPAINTTVMNYYNGIVPSPNQTGAVSGCSGTDAANLRCFTWNLPGRNFQNRYTARIDHQLTQNHAIEFVYNQANYNTTNDVLNAIEQFFPKSPGGGQESKRQVLTWAFHSTFGNNKTNTARFGFQRAPVTFTIKDDFSATGGVQLAFPTVTSPSITSTNLPQGRNTPVRQLTDNFSWVRGHHNLQFNGEWRWVLANSFFFNTVPQRTVLGSNSANPNGITSSDFPGGISSGDLSNASAIFNIVTGLLGSSAVGFNHTSATSGFVPGVPRRITPTQTNLAFSVQDSWRARPNLTLQFGVRWEYQGPFDLRNALMLQPDDRVGAVFGAAGANNVFNVLTTPAATDITLNLAGGRNGRPLINKQYKNFAPLVSVSWDPFGDGKTAVRAGFAMHFTQDGFTLFQLGGTGNAGLFTVASNNTPTGVFSAATPVAITAPTEQIPVSQKAQFALNTGQALWSFKKNLAVPYIEEWNLAIQREIGARFTLEARYIGNHGVKLYRATDYNEINLLNNPYTFGGNSVTNLLTEFNHAVTNLEICRAASSSCSNFSNQSMAGQFPLPVFNALFAGLSSSSGYTNSTFITNLTRSLGLNPGAMFDTLRRSATYAANRNANFPLNYFVPNPWAASTNYVDNSSWSNYNGLEVELRRRFSSGLYFVANWTYSKVMTDQSFVTSQSEFQAYRSLACRSCEKWRAAFDVTHNVSATFLYPLPFGKGQRFMGGANSWVNGLVGGWNLQGITRWNTGAPFQLFTGRFPTGQTSFSSETPVLRNMSLSDFYKNTGVYKTASGVYWLNPNSGLFTISGSSSKPVVCTATTTGPCFAYADPGQLGTTPVNGFNGPSQFNQDFSIRKQTFIPAISESFNFEIRLEAFNVFNHTNFLTPSTTSLQSTQFGQLTGVSDTVRGGGVNSRIVQWGLRVNF